MVEVPLVVIEKVSYSVPRCASPAASSGHLALIREALQSLGPVENVGGVIAATFSNPERFPSLAVRVAAELGLSPSTPAFDLQMACSAYPYAVYLAGRLAADTGKKVLVVNGDCQTPLVDRADHATGEIFSDAMTVSVISSDATATEKSHFDFLSRADDALTCSATGPIHMDGMKVFTFVATEVKAMLDRFVTSAVPRCVSPAAGNSLELGNAAGETHRGTMFFIPHQANPYMVRQLAKALGLTEQLLTLDPALKNPGSCSIPLTLATNTDRIPTGGATALIAGFGAGYSAAVGLVKIL